MDRRESIKGAAAVFGGAFMIVPGPVESIPPEIYGKLSDYAITPGIRRPYDPIAVLEAMRDTGFSLSIHDHPTKPGWTATFYRRDRSFVCGPNPEDYSKPFPDFRSAVLWLHRQAAAVDESFAKAFLVPEGE